MLTRRAVSFDVFQILSDADTLADVVARTKLGQKLYESRVYVLYHNFRPKAQLNKKAAREEVAGFCDQMGVTDKRVLKPGQAFDVAMGLFEHPDSTLPRYALGLTWPPPDVTGPEAGFPNHMTVLRSELAALMVNLGMVKEHSIVFDPFCGSGRIPRVALRSLGGSVFALGSDIFETLAGRSAMMRSFGDQQKGIDGVDRIRCDVLQRTPWRSSISYDAVLFDPPFGLRETLGSKEPGCSQCHVKDHAPEELLTRVEAMVLAALRLVAERMKPGHRVVYLLPVYDVQAGLGGLWPDRDSSSSGFTEDLVSIGQYIPHLPEMFRLLSCSFSPCRSRIMGRRVVVLERR